MTTAGTPEPRWCRGRGAGGGEQPQRPGDRLVRRLLLVVGVGGRDPPPVGRAGRPEPAPGEVVGEVVAGPVRWPGEDNLLPSAHLLSGTGGQGDPRAAGGEEVTVGEHRVEHVHPRTARG